MTNETKTSVGGGLSFGTVLFLVFLVLKLCNVIDWSWWWVTAPLWIPIGVLVAILLVLGMIIGLAAIFKAASKK